MGSPELWIALVALVTSLYAAVQARRSAGASERSAGAAERSAQAGESAATAASRSAGVAEGLIELERGREREGWIGRISEVFPDVRAVGPMLRDLPAWLKPEWKQVVVSAAERSPKMPPALREKYFPTMFVEWERVAQGSEEAGAGSEEKETAGERMVRAAD